MPDVMTPKPIGDQIEDLAGELFDPEVRGEDLALKCRYAYLHGKIKTVQTKGEEPDDRHMEMLNEMEERLMDVGIRPSTVLDV